MSKKITVGTRVLTNREGTLPTEATKPAHYGRITAGYPAGNGRWQVTCPDGTTTLLDPHTHFVVERSTGIVDVAGKIDLSHLPWKGWVGWLKEGVFIEERTQ